jgi:hypothetical protein
MDPRGSVGKAESPARAILSFITCLNGMQYCSGQHLDSVASLSDSQVGKFSYDVLVVLMSYLDCAVLITTNFVQHLKGGIHSHQNVYRVAVTKRI